MTSNQRKLISLLIQDHKQEDEKASAGVSAEISHLIDDMTPEELCQELQLNLLERAKYGKIFHIPGYKTTLLNFASSKRKDEIALKIMDRVIAVLTQDSVKDQKKKKEARNKAQETPFARQIGILKTKPVCVNESKETDIAARQKDAVSSSMSTEPAVAAPSFSAPSQQPRFLGKRDYFGKTDGKPNISPSKTFNS